MNLSTAKIARQINLPLGSLASKTHFQGAAWAKSPVDGKEYLFQMQAQPVGPGEIEDLYVHRYLKTGDTLKFVDTMLAKGFGHCQTLKVRISAANNAQLWLGLEAYDSSNKVVGQQVHKVMFRKGTITRTSSNVIRIFTAGAWCAPVDCPDWTIVLRRSYGDDELFEWYDEREIAAATSADKIAKPAFSLRVPKVSDYQGSCAIGKYTAPGSVFRINGAATDSPQWLTQFPVSGLTAQLATTNILTGSGGGTLEEPEAVFTMNGELWIGKQTSPYTSSRIVGYMLVDLS